MKKETVFMGVGIGVGLFGLAVAGYCAGELTDCKAMLNAATTKIQNMTQVDIDQNLVDRLTKESIEKQSNAAVELATSKVVSATTAEMRTQIKKRVDDEKDHIVGELSKAILKEIHAADVEKIVDEVTSATTDKLVDKLSDELDDEIGQIGKVYKAIYYTLARD